MSNRITSKSNSSSSLYFISIYALFNNSLFIFSHKLSSRTLYSLSILFKYTFFILLSYLNIIYICIYVLLFTTNNTRITNSYNPNPFHPPPPPPPPPWINPEQPKPTATTTVNQLLTTTNPTKTTTKSIFQQPTSAKTQTPGWSGGEPRQRPKPSANPPAQRPKPKADLVVSLGKDPNPAQTHYPRPISAAQAQATESTTRKPKEKREHREKKGKEKEEREKKSCKWKERKKIKDIYSIRALD